MMELIFATGNENKVKEVREILDENYIIRSLKDIHFTDEIEESGKTLDKNALIKAEHIFEIVKKPVFAEDTGLEVWALNGDPGVKTARYAGDEKDHNKNMDLLLKNLTDKADRTAQFRTVAALILEDSSKFLFEGIVKGEIATEKRGHLGFGYDPIFIPDGFDKTFAQMDSDIKSTISHRAIAVNKLISFLKSLH